MNKKEIPEQMLEERINLKGKITLTKFIGLGVGALVIDLTNTLSPLITKLNSSSSTEEIIVSTLFVGMIAIGGYSIVNKLFKEANKIENDMQKNLSLKKIENILNENPIILSKKYTEELNSDNKISLLDKIKNLRSFSLPQENEIKLKVK